MAPNLLRPVAVPHHVLLHIVSRGGFHRASVHALPLLLGRAAPDGCVLEDFMDVSAEHARLDYDPVARTLTMTDLGSRNGTFVFEQGEPVRLAPSTPIVLVGGAGELQIGPSLRVRATLLDAADPTTRVSTGRRPVVAGPTIPYEQKTRAQIDDALEASVLSDVGNAADAYKQAVAGLHAAFASAHAINALREPERRDALLESLSARFPELFSVDVLRDTGLGTSPFPSAAVPNGPPPLSREPSETTGDLAARLTGRTLATTRERGRLAERLVGILRLFVEQAVLAAHSLRGTHDTAADAARVQIASLHRHLFDLEVDSKAAERTVRILFDGILERHWRDIGQQESALRFLAARLAPAALDARIGWRNGVDAFGAARRRCHRILYAETLAHSVVAEALGRKVPARSRAIATRSLSTAPSTRGDDVPSINAMARETAPSPA